MTALSDLIAKLEAAKEGSRPRRTQTTARRDMSDKPIRIFFSELTRRFYASAHYQIGKNGFTTITGKKYDVTNEIAGLIEQHNVEFQKTS